MAFEVVFTTDAAERLEKTANYLQYTCQSPKLASELYDCVSAEIVKLRTKTGFHIVDHVVSDFVGETVYRVRMGRYKIVYKIDESSNRYVVFLFMHESQNLDVSVMRDFESTN